MPHPSLKDINSLPDALADDSFLFSIANVPFAGDGRGLAFNANTVMMPGVRTNPMEIKLFGFARYRPGGHTYGDNRIIAVFSEDRSGQVYNKLRIWHNAGVDHITGASRIGFKTDILLSVFDVVGEDVFKFTFHNSWIEELPSVQLDGSSGSKGMIINATFVYDWVEYLVLGADPLANLSDKSLNTVSALLMPRDIGESQKDFSTSGEKEGNYWVPVTNPIEKAAALEKIDAAVARAKERRRAF